MQDQYIYIDWMLCVYIRPYYSDCHTQLKMITAIEGIN